MASLKRIGDSFLYLRGATLTQRVGEGFSAKESAKLRSIQVDCVKFDELDLMAEDVRTKALGRMGHSTVKREVYISNPTLPDYGIDAVWNESDQRSYLHRCPCGNWVNALETFPDCVAVRDDGTGYVRCMKCGREVTERTIGEWVPAYPDRSNDMEGYQWSHLTSSFNDPAEILENYTNPPKGNLDDVYRLRLGLAHVSQEDKLEISQVLECCNRDLMATSSGQATAMGVDVGKHGYHVIIGIRTGRDRFELLKVACVGDWPDIHDLARKFNVNSAVIDIRPYESAARMFQKSEPYRIFLCEYTENPTQESVWDNKTMLVRAYRTGIFDTTHRLISEHRLSIPRECPEIKEFAKQVCATAKVLEMNKRTGDSVYRYRKLGDEHYRNALNYFYLAASGGRIVSAKSFTTPQRQLVTDNNYARI